jgi:integrase
MGRPLTGSVRCYQGLWWASVPEAKGSARRCWESFASEADARAWLAGAVRARQTGRALPGPGRPRSTGRAPRYPGPEATEAHAVEARSVEVRADIASVAEAWTVAAYEDLRRGGPERAERVRRLIEGYIVPWFGPRTATVADVSYPMAHEWLLDLAGRQALAPGRALAGAPPGPSGRPRGGELSLAEAARAVGVSLPTLRRRWRAGLLPGSYRDAKGRVRVPAAALGDARPGPARPAGLSRTYISDALWALRQVLGFARANGLVPAGFDPTEGLAAPAPDPAAARTRAPRSQPRPLTLPECARVAAHLSPVHQAAFWLQRIMGLRISEAFGVLVGDVVDLGGTGLLAAQGQGGRSFNVRDDDGRVVAVPHKATMKTAAGSRVLVVPDKMMELVRVVVEAFHTDARTGEVDRCARLVPGIKQAGRSGQGSYFTALEDATAAEGLGTDQLGFRVSSHLLRKSLATDLAWETGIEDAVRRRFMGHRAGDDVYGRVYTLDHPEVAPLAKIAAMLDNKVASSIGTLLVPTARRPWWGKGNPLAQREAEVDAVLAAAGWLVEPGDAEDPLCGTERVAAELGIAATTARRWMANGVVTCTVVPDGSGVPRRLAKLSAVWACRDRLAGRVLLPDLAGQLGLRYHEAYQMVRRLGLDLDLYPGTREHQVTADQAAALRAEHGRVRALHRRSMKLAAASAQLEVALSTATALAKNGGLDVDPETDSSGARFVTRASVERCGAARSAAAQRRSAQAAPAVAVGEVARFTGYSVAELMDLVHAGVLEQVPGRRACQLTAASLHAWMASWQQAEPLALVGGSPLGASLPTVQGTTLCFPSPIER